MSLRRALAFAMFCFAVWVSPLPAQTRLSSVVTYLLPVAANNFSVPGAYGSLWRTETWIHNGSNHGLRLSFCPPLSPSDCTLFYEPGVTQEAVDVIATPSNASLVYVPIDAADRVTLSHRLFELTRGAQPNGVAIPVVREDRFIAGDSRLIAIPADPIARVAIRVYNPRGVENATATLEVILPDGTLAGQATLPFVLDGEYPVQLGVVFVGDVLSTFPSVAGVDHFDMKVSTTPADLEYWTMATITDRDTQHVLVVTPN